LNRAALDAARAMLPPGATLRPDDAAIDPVYGGRKGELHGAPVWTYYQTVLGESEDGTVRSGGTTCGIALAYVLGQAGWPRDMVNRRVDDPWSPGGGFEAGAHLMRLVGGAKRRGWYLGPGASGAWRPGDVYHVDHPPKINSDHVGLVERVEALSGGGARVTTIDGGQERGAVIARRVRVLSADGRTLTLDSVPARVLGVIRASPAREA
jgi:hypothetical protein